MSLYIRLDVIWLRYHSTREPFVFLFLSEPGKGGSADDRATAIALRWVSRHEREVELGQKGAVRP